MTTGPTASASSAANLTFAYLYRKHRERGAIIYVVGEQKTPDALRNSNDKFFEWTPPAEQEEKSPARELARAPVEPPGLPLPKRRPRKEWILDFQPFNTATLTILNIKNSTFFIKKQEEWHYLARATHKAEGLISATPTKLTLCAWLKSGGDVLITCRSGANYDK